MAHVAVLVPDLLFGSKVQSMLATEGHDVRVAGSPDALAAAAVGAELVIADLVSDPPSAIAAVTALRADGLAEGVRLLGFFAHTDTQVRTDALAAGFDQVVPRSRMAREGADVVARLLASTG